jgi:hypothetical protein
MAETPKAGLRLLVDQRGAETYRNNPPLWVGVV